MKDFNSMSLGQAALEYAALGFCIFPVKPKGKAPLCEHGLRDATTDPAVIREWWRRWPDANIGLNCGMSELVVVDLDRKPDFNGHDAWSRLRRRHAIIDHTPTSHTGGGGLHIFFAADGRRIRNSAGKPAAGIEIKGDGGSVTLPPSIHPNGTHYRWDYTLNLSFPMRPFPETLARLLARAEPPPAAPDAVIPDGRRNIELASRAGAMRRRGMSPDAIEAALLIENQRQCNPPLAENEVRAIARSIARYEAPAARDESATLPCPLEALPLPSFLLQTPGEIAWSVEGILPREGAAILAGPAGYGKSWMLLDLAIEHCRGGKWLGRFATTAGRVLYLDEESSPALLGHRLKKLLAGKKTAAEAIDLHLMVGRGLSFSDPASVEQLRGIIEHLRPKLIVVDSLIRVHRADENSASDMAAVFAIIKDLIRSHGCAFLLADHQRKPKHFSTSLDLLLRGSSEKAAFVDSLLSLTRRDEILIVEHSKSRYGEPAPAFVVQITDIGPDATAVGYGGAAEEVRQAARQEEAGAFILAALADGAWVARKELVERAKEAGIGTNFLDDVLKTMVGRQIERENRRATTGMGRPRAHYRLKDGAGGDGEATDLF